MRICVVVSGLAAYYIWAAIAECTEEKEEREKKMVDVEIPDCSRKISEHSKEKEKERKRRERPRQRIRRLSSRGRMTTVYFAFSLVQRANDIIARIRVHMYDECRCPSFSSSFIETIEREKCLNFYFAVSFVSITDKNDWSSLLSHNQNRWAQNKREMKKTTKLTSGMFDDIPLPMVNYRKQKKKKKIQCAERINENERRKENMHHK